MLTIVIPSALAEYKDPTTRVNINRQTDLFDKSVDDWSGLQRQLDADKESAIKGSGSADITFLTGKNANELQAESDNLNNIKAIDLNDRGKEQILKENVINDLYVDYNKPLNKEHLKDAKRLAAGQDKLLANLLEKLKELGVDCKAEKGLNEVEPTYYMQVEQKQHKDTKYNKTICEELRNTYQCNDSVSLTCTRKGIGYGEWEARTIKFSGGMLHNEKMNWGYATKWKDKRWGWHITPHHPLGWGEYQIDSPWSRNPDAIIADARAYIAAKLSVQLEQIGGQVGFPESGRGIGNINPVGHRWRVVWDEYEFSYQFREVFDTCEEWKEDWTERCGLQ